MCRNKVYTVFSIVLLVLAGHYSSNCQGSGVDMTGTGGMHTIQGRIFLPNGRIPDFVITVKLESPNQPARSIVTDRNGSFSFRQLSPGNYSVVIDAGESYLIATEYFLIEAEAQGRVAVRVDPIPKVFNVPVYLQYKPNAAINNDVVNAKFANIPKEALQHCQKGLELSRAGKDDDAIKAFRLAISVYPQFALPHTEIGKILIKIGKTNEAIDELALAIKFDPNDFDTRLNYGIALIAKKDLNDAEKELRGAVELNKTAVTPHFYLGLLFVQSNNLDDAQKEMETANQLKGEKEFPLVHKYLGGIYWAKREYRMAVQQLEKYVKLSPDAKDADQTRRAIVDLQAKIKGA